MADAGILRRAYQTNIDNCASSATKLSTMLTHTGFLFFPSSPFILIYYYFFLFFQNPRLRCKAHRHQIALMPFQRRWVSIDTRCRRIEGVGIFFFAFLFSIPFAGESGEVGLLYARQMMGNGRSRDQTANGTYRHSLLLL